MAPSIAMDVKTGANWLILSQSDSRCKTFSSFSGGASFVAADIVGDEDDEGDRGASFYKMRMLELRVEAAEKESAAAQEKYLNALKKIVKLQEQVKASSKRFQDLKMTLDEWREGALPEEILMK